MKEEKNYAWVVCVACFIAGMMLSAYFCYYYYDNEKPTAQYPSYNTFQKAIINLTTKNNSTVPFICYNFLLENRSMMYEAFNQDKVCFEPMIVNVVNK